MDDNQCQVKRCKQEAALTYSASKSKRKRDICRKHFNLHCNGVINLKHKNTFKKSKKN
jgi:hypothetical protein